MSQVTMKDIAQKAGITRQTVSEILNNKTLRVSKSTREKVLQIAREMNYRPNYFAKTLKTGITNYIGIRTGISIVDVNSYYVYKVIEGIDCDFSATI